MAIEGWPFIDALYMTVITVATVGYGEIHRVSPAGRLFTMVLIFLGVGYFLYVVGNFIPFLVEGRIRHILGRRNWIAKLTNSRIIISSAVWPYGACPGAVSHSTLPGRGCHRTKPARTAVMDEDGILYLVGSATDESLLMRAGIERARGLWTVVGSDADNVFLVLLARQMNPAIFIVARAVMNSAKRTLTAAGANKVVSPYDLGARRMAHAILRPTVIEFLEMAFADDSMDVEVEEITIRPHSPVVHRTLYEAEIRPKFNVIIISIKKEDGKMVFNPDSQTLLEGHDTLVVVGAAASIKSLEKLLAPG